MRLSRMQPSLFARMALILALGLFGTQAISLWLHWDERAAVVSQTRGQHLFDRIAEIIRVLEAEDPQRRPTALAALQSDDVRILAISTDQAVSSAPHSQLVAALAARLGTEREVRGAAGMGRGAGMGGGIGRGMGMGMGAGMGIGHGQGWQPGALRSFDIRLTDGQWIRIVASREPDTPAPPTGYFIQLLLSLIIVVVVVMLAVRLATRPLQQLARAADEFGRRLDAPALAESGPSETRQAAQAFNRMQQRIRHLVDERSRALAAVSHDLRTPLTRLRLRAELVDDEKLREQMADDLEAMSAMLDNTLDYLRGMQENEALRPIDINALLQSLAEDARLLGREMTIEGSAQTPFIGHLTGLRRALQNLVDNAVKYGQRAHVRVEDGTEFLLLVVDDEGPGIPPEELAKVTAPYYRPDASRNLKTGGVGLGLSIVSDIAQRHGGELRLENRPDIGLRASLRLPRTPR